MPSVSSVAVGGKVTAAKENEQSGWINAIGLISVIPASVAGTGVTVGTAGKVTASASPAISANGCFTSTYDNYLIIPDLTASGAAQILLTFRVSGTDAATAYDNQRLITVSTGTTASQVLNTTSIIAGSVSLAARTTGQVFVAGPALVAATEGWSNLVTTANPMTTSAGATQVWFLHRTLATYDGFTIAASTGTLTGNIRIYGYNNN